MNTSSQVKDNRTLELGPNTARFLGDGNTVLLKDTDDGHMVVMLRDESIELAKAILVRNKVPFCNRVEGAGVSV